MSETLSENEKKLLLSLQETLASVSKERNSTFASIGLLSLGILVVAGSVIYSYYSLSGVEAELKQKNDQVAELKEQIGLKQTLVNSLTSQAEELNRKINVLKETLPNDFAGKFAIQLESDVSLDDAKKNVYKKGRDFGFLSVFIFKLPVPEKEGIYKTVAVFDSYESAKEASPRARKANPTAGDFVQFNDYCRKPVWNDDEGYYDCDQIKKPE